MEKAQQDTAGLIHSLLKGLVKHKASDLHLKMGRPPLYRVNGVLIPTKYDALTDASVKQIAYAMMTKNQITTFEQTHQIDFGYVVPGLARFRANVYMQRSTVAVVIRVVPLSVPILEELNLPSVIQELSLRQRGLLLVTGATGSGKSTTLAAMIDYINRNSRSHIITIEDPIEYWHDDKNSTLSQRELGVDTPSMAIALRAALRQDPDVIMVGEMRDYETIQTALTAAETGHLVLSTLHTNSAVKTLDRIMDSFPAESKNQIRMQLGTCLVGIVSQRLLRKQDGEGRAVACEILTRSPSIEKLIVENKLGELDPMMEGSSVYYKMQTMNQALAKLVQEKVVSLEDALASSDRPEDLRLKLSGMVSSAQGADTNTMLEQPEDKELDLEDIKASGIKLEAPVVNSAVMPRESSAATKQQEEKSSLMQRLMKRTG